jgi:sporulation protein YlmC with PRC-barrel domain
MKKISNLIVVLSILTLGLLIPTVYASESNSRGWDRSYQASEIIGLWVTNHQGKYLGKVQDFVFDPDGHVIFAIIGYSRFNWRLIGENSVAVPFKALAYDHNPKHPMVVTDIALEKFQSAPKFAKNDLMNRQRETEIYRYFGQQPYWTEGTSNGMKGHSMEKPMKELW